MGSVLAGFIIGIQQLGICYIPTAFPVRFSACHFFDSFVRTEFWSHDRLFQLIDVISWYLSSKPDQLITNGGLCIPLEHR